MLCAQERNETGKKARKEETRKNTTDSAQAERTRILDSTKAAQKQVLDRQREERDRQMAIVKAERERKADSLVKIRKYKESKRYKDSVAAVRQARVDSIKQSRQAILDSIKLVRKRTSDSVVAVRKAYTDSIKAVQKKRADSLAAIKKYRQSKRYTDSVAVVRKLKSDSIKAVRTAHNDSVTAGRKRVSDSISAARQAKADSIAAERKIYTDSVAGVRKNRADSLAKLKAKKEADRATRAKQREQKAQLALELKIKKKQEAYNNEQMLKKKWGFPRSVIHNMFTRFNYYFNADQKMDEALDNMQRFRKENYDSLLALFPFDPDRDSSVLAPDMDSIIQKASLGIQIHDPRTKWGDDLYLLLGQAYYYKGDYKNASDAFKYVVSLRDKKGKRKVTKETRNSVVQAEGSGLSKLLTHRSVHNEAILWLARVYTQQHKEGDAESVLDLVETDPNFSGSLAGRIALEKAFIRLNQQDYKGAIEPLTVVSNDKDMPDWIRMRTAYIGGQLYQRYEEYPKSAERFSNVLDLNPKIEMEFAAKKNLATSLMLAGGEQAEAIAMLKKILKDGKYAQYYEQVYYLLGRLSANSNNTDEAISYLDKSIAAAKSTNEQKAKSFAMLGDIYYTRREYEQSKTSYDSAIVYAGNAINDAEMQTALRRSVALEKLTVPLRTVRNNDSLMALSAMDDKERKAVVRKYIKYLEDKRADSIFQAENAGLNAALKNAGNTNNNSKNNFVNWYFSNAALMQKGYNDFKQKWGSRPLVDNWRRSAAGGFARDDNSNSGDDGTTGPNGIPTEESLLAAIPITDSAKQSNRQATKEAYIAAANAYVRDLEDYPPGIGVLDTFDKRFPVNELSAEAVYLRYLAALKQNHIKEAKKHAAHLLANFGDSKWAQMLRPTEDGSGMDAGNTTAAAYYDTTYELLLNHAYVAVIPRARFGQKMYEAPYPDKFRIIEAAALAMTDEFKPADSILTAYLQVHTDPNDSLRRWADAIMKYIAEKRVLLPTLPDNSNTKQAAAAAAPASDGGKAAAAAPPQAAAAAQAAPTPPPLPLAEDAAEPAPAEYTYDAQSEHYVMFSFKKMEQRTKGVQAGIEDFNKFKFGSLALGTEVNMLNETDGLIVVKTFTNRNQAVIYMNTLKKTDQVFREYQSGEYSLMMISSANYLKLAKDKDITAYTRFYRTKY